MAMGVSDASRNYKAWRWLGSKISGVTGQVVMFAGDSNGDKQAETMKNIRSGWDKWKLEGYSAWIVSAPGVMRQARSMTGSGATGGTQGGSGGGAAAGQAAAAVQAGMPTYTGGGASFGIGGVNESIIMQQRDDEFLGVDTFTPEEKLAAGYSPDAINWDGFSRIGSRCVRRGSAKLEDDHASLSKNSALRGISLALIPNGTEDQLQLLYSFADNDIGSVRSSVATDITVVTTAPRWGRPTTLKGWQGPKIALSDQGSQVLRVTSDYTNVFNNSTQKGYRANSVIGITVRYSVVGYPRDIDGYDYLKDQGTPSAALRDNLDRSAWTGASRDDDSATLTAGLYYVTAWAISREGISEPSFATLTLA
jgi:hypothetical protein